MPSSMIFTGLVVLWLIVLVPTFARRRQEVERPSVAALSGRVLARPQRQHSTEVGRMTVHEHVRTTEPGLDADPVDEVTVGRVPGARTAAEAVSAGSRGPTARPAEARPDPRPADPRPADPRPADTGDPADGPASADGPESPADGDGTDRDVARGRLIEDVDDREMPPARYRPGRGGFDAEAALVTARARYAFRQRVVLTLLIGVAVTGVVAAVSVPGLWWANGVLDVLLVGYLGYLRRQVRMEDAIRNRRSARLAGGRHGPSDDGASGRDGVGSHDIGRDRAGSHDTGRDRDSRREAWAGSGRGAAARAAGPAGAGEDDDVDGAGDGEALVRHDGSGSADLGGAVDLDGSAPRADEPEPERVAGTGEPVGLLRVLPETVEATALPRLLPVPPPPLPAGTTLVEADDADLALSGIDLPHRRAVGE